MRQQVDAARRSPDGAAAATLLSVGTRTAAVIRCVGAAYVIVQVGIWHPFYSAGAWRLAGPAVAVGWTVALVVWLAHHRPAGWLLTADTAVLVMLALSSAWWVPPEMRGDTASWLYILLAAQLVFPAWSAPLGLAAPLLLASGVAYWAGADLLSAALAPNSAPGASTMLFFTAVTVAWIGFQMLGRRAVLADTALAEADAAEHDQYIALRRHTERREHERLLHDTVLNTLTALSRAGAGGGASDGGSDMREIVGRCRHDVALMEYVLGGSRDPDQAAQGRKPHDRVLVVLEALALEMRARGLDVHIQATAAAERQAGGADAPAPAPTPAPAPAPVPVPVVAAVGRAVREALGNVARHAGTGEAWVEVLQPESGSDPPDGGWLTVTVRDHGIGFDPRRVAADRLGIARSIVERIADCGGVATVQSAPGSGTTVTMRLPVHAGTVEPRRANMPGPGL